MSSLYNIKIDTAFSGKREEATMEDTKKTRKELLALCKEKGIKGYSTKKKEELLELLNQDNQVIQEDSISEESAKEHPKEKIVRLNYIGSKFQLLDWITASIQEKTQWESLEHKVVADIFAGTGIVSYHFRKQGAIVYSNDAERYSSIIAHAFTRSTYTEMINTLMEQLQQELKDNKHETTVGYITTHYSPYDNNERMFFTVENAKRIDYLRMRLEDIQPTITNDDYCFLLASLLSSADAVSNVPAVYGCYLKNFKAKAMKPLVLVPIHTNSTLPASRSASYHKNVLDPEFLSSFECDMVYLDPPYNERQYSKNYFPLNIIAKTPEQLKTEEPLKGKTGIPTDCFLSPFCKKGEVEDAFDTLFRELKTKWIFLSYNSESLVTKEKMLERMQKYGTASVIERDYKRFKSFEYNKDVEIKEYLFCLEKA